MDLLAVLGRGIFQGADGKWHPEEDLEMWGISNNSIGHVQNPKPVDDGHPFCFVGGTELNILAGIELCRKFSPAALVCAYGARGPYLKNADAPSESEVITKYVVGSLAAEKLSIPVSRVWTKAMDIPGPSNTNREILNIFSLAVEQGWTKVGVVTITVHLPRVIVFAKRHLADERFQNLKVQFFSSEQVIIEADPMQAMRVLALYRSQSFGRTAASELNGTRLLFSGEYY